MARLRSYERSAKGKAKQAAYYASKSAERRRAAVVKKYGLTPEAYATLLDAQQGCCAICRRAAGARALDVDHDHGTGRVRGLLCRPCNVSLGLMGDSPDRLRSAAAYLA